MIAFTGKIIKLVLRSSGQICIYWQKAHLFRCTKAYAKRGRCLEASDNRRLAIPRSGMSADVALQRRIAPAIPLGLAPRRPPYN